MIIRKGTAQDVEKVLPLFLAFHEESLAQYGLTVDTEDALKTLTYFAQNHLSLVAENVDGEIVGVIAGMIQPYPLNARLTIFQESVWYITKEHRMSSVGIALLEKTEEVLAESGVTFGIMANMSNLRDDQISRFYERKGYARMESHFIKRMEAKQNA